MYRKRGVYEVFRWSNQKVDIMKVVVKSELSKEFMTAVLDMIHKNVFQAA